jgi:O-antigen/teichoic acid export membrane protein
MTNDQVKKNIWRNSISNYIYMGLNMALRLVMFRMLYRYLTQEQFGFWSVLWTVFGYGILLDFGFGFAAEKRVAQLSATGEWDHLSRVLSTIFFLYVFVGLFMILAIFAFSQPLIDFFHVSSVNRESFRWLLIIFFCGMGVTFPLGMFPGMLTGLQRIALVNSLFFIGLVCNFVGLCAAVHFHWSMLVLVSLGIMGGIIPTALAAFFALRSMPQVKIRLRNFSFGMIRETTQFSLFAYVITVSNILLAKTDQLVISGALAVSAVAIYQAGAKVGETFNTFAGMLPSTFSPAAAHLHAKGDKAFLRELLIHGTRASVMVATPVYFICAFYMEGLLRILTGAPAAQETFWIGQVLLFWGYTWVITQSVTKQVLIMCGHEKKMMWLAVLEVTLNLGLSIGLILYYRSVICVAWGSLIASLIVGWGFLWPWTARSAQISMWQLAQTVLIPVWLACIPLLAFLLAGRLCPWMDFRASTPLFMAEALIALCVGAGGLWKLALTVNERQQLLSKMGRSFA